jgi:Holliday junction resolvase RusA-like endonuclease
MTNSPDIVIALAGAPMGKQRIRVARDGHAYTPERTVTFESRLAYAAQQIMGARPLLDGEIVCDIVIVMPIPKGKPRLWQEAAVRCGIRPTKKPDFDNFAKIVDALNLIVWVDDSHVVRGVVDKFYGARPMFAVKIRPADGRDRTVPPWAVNALGALEPEGVFA